MTEQTLADRNAAFIREHRRKGHKIVWLKCPACHRSHEVPAALKGDRHQGAAICPHCDTRFIKAVTATRATGQLPKGLDL